MTAEGSKLSPREISSEMELNRTQSYLVFVCIFVCLPRLVLDHYFNVRLGVSGREMELTRNVLFWIRPEETTGR